MFVLKSLFKGGVAKPRSFSKKDDYNTQGETYVF